MMGKMSRDKGAAAEREVFKIIRDTTGIDIMRNLEQYQGTDSDAHILGFCIEIKRVEQLSLKTWWDQVLKVARKSREVPVLIYRQSRQPWRVMLPWASTSYMLHDDTALAEWMLDFDYTQTILLEPMFTMLLSESQAGADMMQEAADLIEQKH